MTDTGTPTTLEMGARVEVRSRFDGHWARGFELAAIEEDGYVVRRVSDGTILPAHFSAEEVRPDRHRTGMWWYRA